MTERIFANCVYTFKRWFVLSIVQVKVFCSSRKTHAFGLLTDGTPRFTCNGKPVYHFMACSAFSQYVVLPHMSVCKVCHMSVCKFLPISDICSLLLKFWPIIDLYPRCIVWSISDICLLVLKFQQINDICITIVIFVSPFEFWI